MDKVQELIALLKEGQVKEEKAKKCNTVWFILAVVGAIAAVCGIAYAIYRHFSPDYLGEFDEDDFDDFDDFEDFFDAADNDDFDEDATIKITSEDDNESEAHCERKIVFPKVK
jgi:hypothetical protein